MSKLHCHVQIEYTGMMPVCGELQEMQVETLAGFDPTEDREYVHAMLDEYLNYLERRMNEAKKNGLTNFKPKYEDNWFKVFDEADTH